MIDPVERNLCFEAVRVATARLSERVDGLCGIKTCVEAAHPQDMCLTRVDHPELLCP